MPALKVVQVALVTSSLLTVGGLATYDVWGSKAPVALEFSDFETVAETPDVVARSYAWAGPVIPDLRASTASIGSQFAYVSSMEAGDEVAATQAMLDDLAAIKKKPRKKKMRFGAFEGY